MRGFTKISITENLSCVSHWEPRNLPRSPQLGPRWSDPFNWYKCTLVHLEQNVWRKTHVMWIVGRDRGNEKMRQTILNDFGIFWKLYKFKYSRTLDPGLFFRNLLSPLIYGARSLYLTQERITNQLVGKEKLFLSILPSSKQCSGSYIPAQNLGLTMTNWAKYQKGPDQQPKIFCCYLSSK